MANLLKIIQSALSRRKAPAYQKLVTTFGKHRNLSDAAAEEVTDFYLKALAELIRTGGKVIPIDRDAITALDTGQVDVDEKKFAALLDSDLVKKAVDKVSKKDR